MTNFILTEESYKIIGLWMELQIVVGMGFKEIIYKNASEIKFLKKSISYPSKKNLQF